MKKRLIKVCSLVLVMLMAMSNVAFANTKQANLVLSSKDVDTLVQPRSLYLASGISEVTNQGEGVLSIYADFAAYRAVDWACLTITLERRKGTSGSWSYVKTYKKEFLAEDEGGMLLTGSTDFDVYGLTTDYYYRVKCEHKVKTPSGTYETKNSQTDGVLLTSYPVYRNVDEVKQKIIFDRIVFEIMVISKFLRVSFQTMD